MRVLVHVCGVHAYMYVYVMCMPVCAHVCMCVYVCTCVFKIKIMYAVFLLTRET